MIDIERMRESALKSHMKDKKHKGNTCATRGSTPVMSTFLRKEVSSSCDQRSEPSCSCAETQPIKAELSENCT